MSNREIETDDSGNLPSIAQFEHIVFLGTFNADPFKVQIESWLSELDLTDVAIIVADNLSTDNTVHWISEVIANLNCYSEITVNERNFGGYGTLAVNLDKFNNAKWITILHQDDQYLRQHVQNHREVISRSDTTIGMIFSEAISISPDGQKMGYPRAHWLLEDNSDPVTVFLAHLRNHAYPFSGATFSKDVFLNFPIPWHSNAFPDTEIVMKMAVDYKAVFAPDLTVKYLENPNSESHSLSPQQRDFGAFQALIRVFAHPNYQRLCEQVPKREVQDFLMSLDEGISLRFQDPHYSRLMKQAAFEITAQHIGTSQEMATYLAEGYLRVGDVRALETLRSLGARIPAEVTTEPMAKTPLNSDVKLGRNFERAAVLAAFLPRWLRRAVFKAFMKTKLGKNSLAGWDFDWRES